MDSACHLKWLHESPDCLLILRFEDQDEGVQAIEYRVGYDFNAKLHGVEWAEVPQKHIALFRVTGRAGFNRVLVVYIVQRHDSLLKKDLNINLSNQGLTSPFSGPPVPGHIKSLQSWTLVVVFLTLRNKLFLPGYSD